MVSVPCSSSLLFMSKPDSPLHQIFCFCGFYLHNLLLIGCRSGLLHSTVLCEWCREFWYQACWLSSSLEEVVMSLQREHMRIVVENLEPYRAATGQHISLWRVSLVVVIKSSFASNFYFCMGLVFLSSLPQSDHLSKPLPSPSPLHCHTFLTPICPD